MPLFVIGYESIRIVISHLYPVDCGDQGTNVVLRSSFSYHKTVYKDGEEQMRFLEREALNIIANKKATEQSYERDKFFSDGIIKAPFQGMTDSSSRNALSIYQNIVML